MAHPTPSLATQEPPASDDAQAVSRAIAWIDSIPATRIAALRAAGQRDAERLQAFVAAGGHPDEFDPSL